MAIRTLDVPIRDALPEEVKLGTAYLASAGQESWIRFAQALLSANELVFVN